MGVLTGTGITFHRAWRLLFQIMQFESYFCLETFGFHFVTGFHFSARPHAFPRHPRAQKSESIAVALRWDVQALRDGNAGHSLPGKAPGTQLLGVSWGERADQWADHKTFVDAGT